MERGSGLGTSSKRLDTKSVCDTLLHPFGGETGPPMVSVRLPRVLGTSQEQAASRSPGYVRRDASVYGTLHVGLS